MVITSTPALRSSRVGVGVAVVGEHHTRRDGDQVVPAVPLLAFGIVSGAAGFDHPQRAPVPAAATTTSTNGLVSSMTSRPGARSLGTSVNGSMPSTMSG